MRDSRWLVTAAAGAVVAAAAAGALALWPDGSGPALSAARHDKPSPKPLVVDGIPNGAHVSATGLLQRNILGHAQVCIGDEMVLDSFASRISPCDDAVVLRGLVLRRGTREAQHTVVGTWRSGVIVVKDVLPPEPNPDDTRLTDPPCPAPPGGWAHLQNYNPLTPNLDDRPLEHYRHTHRHVLTAIAFFRPEELRPVLTVASTEPAATRAALAPAYPDALCVVASRHSWAQLATVYHRLRKALFAREIPGAYELGKQITSSGQPVIELGIRNDRPEVTQLLRGVPPDLVDVHELIRINDAS